jgi:succinyl-CoA synthetase beta subunit
MDLLEYQGKQLFARHGVPVPTGSPATTLEQAVAAADGIGYPCVIKAQVLIGGRGKAGGIKVANDRDEAESHARAILGMDIRGFTVHEVWIEAASDIAVEYYTSIVFDRAAKKPLVLLSTQGGMDIEEVAEKDPKAIARLHVDPLIGFSGLPRAPPRLRGRDRHGRHPPGRRPAREALRGVRRGGGDARRGHPLIITGERKVVALDAKVTLDDNSLFRHPQNAELRNPSGEDPQERMAKERGLTYVSLDGNIGILGNGAGLVMSTLDVVAQAGGSPANFLDAGGGSKAEAITSAVEVILNNPSVKAVLFNIFGGITRCDEVAKGPDEGSGRSMSMPLWCVLAARTQEVRKLLADANLPHFPTESSYVLECNSEPRRRAAKGLSPWPKGGGTRYKSRSRTKLCSSGLIRSQRVLPTHRASKRRGGWKQKKNKGKRNTRGAGIQGRTLVAGDNTIPGHKQHYRLSDKYNALQNLLHPRLVGGGAVAGEAQCVRQSCYDTRAPTHSGGSGVLSAPANTRRRISPPRDRHEDAACIEHVACASPIKCGVSAPNR